MKNSTKIIILVLLVLVAGVTYIEYPKQEKAVACTAEAKICPDGSSVGRAGPQCEFSACPSAFVTTFAGIGKKITINDVNITPLEIIEDSRCPVDVQCIQAGTVRLTAVLETNGKSENVTVRLGTPTAFSGKNITLTEVTPIKSSKIVIAKKDYIFNFSVENISVVTTTKGTLKGNVTIGPVCPVEMVGNPCLPSPEVYAAAQVFVYLEDKKTLVTTLTPDKDGNFSTQLSSGTYFVDMIHQRIGGTTGVPTTVTIKSGEVVKLNLHVDTGLR